MCVGVWRGVESYKPPHSPVTVQTVLLNRLLPSANPEISEKPGSLQELGLTCPPFCSVFGAGSGRYNDSIFGSSSNGGGGTEPRVND